MQEPPMTPEAKAALMQFVGQTYGQMNKQDQMIVGQSGNLQPKSDQLRQTFESVAKMPTAQMPQQAPHPQQAPPAEEPPQQVAPVTPDQAAQELQQQAMPSSPVGPEGQPGAPGQLDLDFSEPSKADKLINILEKQNLILKEISLKLDNGKPLKVNKQKRIS